MAPRKMNTRTLIGILAVFTLTFTMAVLLPSVRADSIDPPGTTLQTQWAPSGPASHTISYNYYAGEDGEFSALQAGSIDLTDTPLNPVNVPTFCPTGTSFLCTGVPPNPKDPEFGFQHNDINLANSFWGITFCFAQDGVTAGGFCQPKGGTVSVPGYPFTTATCPNVPAPHTGDCTYAGIQWRQGFAQLLDKQDAVGKLFGGAAQPLDNLGTVPAQNQAHSGLPFDVVGGTAGSCRPLPNTGPSGCVGAYNTGAPANYAVNGVCGWDSLHTTTATGLTNCTSALNYPGTSGHANGITWDPGSTNFCDAADHWVAAGIATGHTTGAGADCHLTGLLASGTVVFAVRSDSGNRRKMGNALVTSMCQLLYGASTTSCGTTDATHPLAVVNHQLTITDAFTFVFSGSSTNGITTNTPNLDWHLYTGANSGGPAFNQQWALYDSLFTSTICGGSSVVPASPTGDFPLPNDVYSCNPKLDKFQEMVENNVTITGAGQALQVAMDIYGNHTISPPTFSRTQQFAYLKGWQGVSDATGIGTATGNFFTFLNAWKSDSGGTIRWGQKSGTSSLNPFTFTTVFEFNAIQEVYDSLLVFSAYVPTSGAQVFGYMANSFGLVSHTGAVGTTDANCPAAIGVFPVQGCIKLNLRGDISFQDGVQVTASDVKFSFENYNATGGIVSPSTANTVDVVFDPRVLPTSLGGTEAPGQPENVYIALASANAFATLDITGVPIVPAHLWQTSAGACKDTGITATTVGNGKGTAQCTVAPSFLTDPVLSDPVASNKFIGSGSFACTSPDGTVIGGGCSTTGTSAIVTGNGALTLTRFGSGLSPQGATGSGATSVYFRTNADYKQFLWAAQGSHTPGGVDGFALAADLACPTTVTPNFCSAYNSPDAVVTCISSAGACNGSAAGGAGLASPTHSDFVGYASQIVRWSNILWTSPFAYSSLDGAIPAPNPVAGVTQVLYEDGSVYT